MRTSSSICAPQPNSAPAFLCRSCGTRFASNKAYTAHTARRHFAAEHRELKQRRAIFDAQSVLLRHAKFLVSKRLFPAYFTLVPEKTLPLDYYPQVMDYIGEEGRPMGAIEPEMLIRVEVGDEREERATLSWGLESLALVLVLLT